MKDRTTGRGAARARAARLAVALAALACAMGLRPARAAADDLVDLEVSLPVAVAERATTGTGDALAGYGYDHQTGLLTGLELRLYTTGFGRYLRMGAVVGAQQHAGPALGLTGGHAFRSTLIDAGVSARTVFPCMSSDDVRWQLSGLLGVSGMVADAGPGVGVEPNGPDEAERLQAARELDHGAIGWRLAVDLAVHLESFFVGVGLGVRQLFAIDAVAARTWIADAGLRVGGRIDFGDHASR